jgi:hypothetical protein
MRCAKNDLADDLDTVMGQTNVFGSASRRKCQMCPDDLYHLRGSPQNMGHNRGTGRGDSLVANRRQNKGLWCSAVQFKLRRVLFVQDDVLIGAHGAQQSRVPLPRPIRVDTQHPPLTAPHSVNVLQHI